VWKARIWVAVVAFIAGILMIEFLQPIAARIGVIALFIFAVSWSRRTIEYRKKIGFLILSLVLIVGVESIEFSKNVVARQKRFDQIDAENEAASAENEAASRLKAQQAEDAFNKMTPAQHLAAAKDALRVEASSDQIAEGMKHLTALHGTSFENQAEALRNHYEAEQKMAEKVQTAQVAEAQEVLREPYAKTLENNMLSQDMDVDVEAIGPRHTTLRMKYVLATKVWAYQITESSSMQSNFQDMRAIGFKKFVLWNGYDQSWTWTLDK